jgi:hypothetical protein
LRKQPALLVVGQFEGYGLQPVHKPRNMNRALAPEVEFVQTDPLPLYRSFAQFRPPQPPIILVPQKIAHQAESATRLAVWRSVSRVK